MFSMMLYIQAELESGWALHLEAVKEMIPLFFAAGHINYACYALYCLYSIESMPASVYKHFIKGEHMMHHTTGVFAGMSSEMAIETIYMRHRHSEWNWITSITLKPETVKTQAYSRHICMKLLQISIDCMEVMFQSTNCCTQKCLQHALKHMWKTENAFHDKLTSSIDPLDCERHPSGLINIVTFKIIMSPYINVDRATAIGKEQMPKFE